MKISVIRYLFLLTIIPIFGMTPCFSLTIEMRRISDNTPISSLRFTPAQKTAIYTQGESYADIQCTPEDAVGLKIFSNNQNWQGGTGTDRAGLVNNPPTRRVPVYWYLSGTPQTITMNATNEASWKNLIDQNTAGFNGLDPAKSDITCPSNGRAYIYFSAKMNSTTSSTYYTTAVYFSNVPVGGSGGGGGNPSIGDGFGPFNTVFRPSLNPNLDIPINVSNTGKVEVFVYGRNGERIRELFSGEKTSGSHIVTWNGKSDDNTLVPSGLYFVTLNKKYRKKIAVIR